MKRPSFTKKDVVTILVIFVAAVIMAFNIKSFVRTAGLYPGGANGLTILIQHMSEAWFGVTPSFTVINLIINSIPLYIGFRYVGKKFTFYSLIMIIVAGVITDLIPGIPITEDILLISIFGGIINGAAISLCLRAGATFGGTDIIAIFLSERKGVDAFSYVLAANAVIIATAGILFGWDKALYSIIFQYVSTVTIRLLYRKFQRSTLFIVTNKPKEVCAVIYDVARHGATILEGEGSYGHTERSVIYSVVDKPQAKHVIKAVRECDPKAFVNEIRTEKLTGHFYQKPEE
ncbi:Uncharacterized membrane-anchored protein YitT, contains DUF161 and DUF2179 domains [Ruminococcaceae bacterium YRB3002]|nr:Uncharacterized membrane-anchored protein YitT, contains DUF161 and DUF2179 domains [Ruminococcaceae bacterium YRB3002]